MRAAAARDGDLRRASPCAQIQNLRLLSTQKPAFIISGRRDLDMAGRIIMSLRLLSNCGDLTPPSLTFRALAIRGCSAETCPWSHMLCCCFSPLLEQQRQLVPLWDSQLIMRSYQTTGRRTCGWKAHASPRISHSCPSMAALPAYRARASPLSLTPGTPSRTPVCWLCTLKPPFSLLIALQISLIADSP